MSSKVLLTVPEAAELLGLGKSKVWELVQSGELTSVLIGRCRRIPRTSLDEFVDALCEEQP